MTSEKISNGIEVGRRMGIEFKRGGGAMSVEGMRDEMDEGTIMNLYVSPQDDVNLQLFPPNAVEPFEITFVGGEDQSQHPHLAQILKYIPSQLFNDEGGVPFLNDEVVLTSQEDLEIVAGNSKSLRTGVYGVKGDKESEIVMDILVQDDGDTILVLRNPGSSVHEEMIGYSINFNTYQGGTRIPVAGWAFARIALSLAGKFPYRG